MKKTLQLLGAFAIIATMATSCGTAEEAKDESKTPIENIEENITKKVQAEINDAGEATVTITTSENGEETVTVLTGEEAKAYLEEEKLNMEENSDESSSSKIIIKKSDSDGDDIDIEEIMNSEELKGMEEDTKEKVKEALEEANSEIELRTEKTSKVIVIEK